MTDLDTLENVVQELVDRHEPRIERLRRMIETAYERHPTGCGGSFGEILCWEIHSNGQTFRWLAKKWGISLPTLGKLIADHCDRLEEDPVIQPLEERPGKVLHTGISVTWEKDPSNA